MVPLPALMSLTTLAHLGHSVLQIGHRRQRRSIKRIFINEFADRALPARDLAGNAFDVGDGPPMWPLFCFTKSI